MLQNKLKKLSENRGPIEHSSFVEKTSISTFFKNKIGLHDKKVVLTGVEPDTGVVEDGWSGSDEDPPVQFTRQVHPHYLLEKQQHGLDRMTESEDSDYVYDPNVQEQNQNFPILPLFPTTNLILDVENQNLLDEINRNQQKNENDQNNQNEKPNFNQNRTLQSKSNPIRKKFTYEPATREQELRAQALNTLEWNQYLKDQQENDRVRAREYRKRKAAAHEKHTWKNARFHSSGVIHPKAAGDDKKARFHPLGVIHPKAAGDVSQNGGQRRNNKQYNDRKQARKPAPWRSGTRKNQLQNLEVKYKKSEDRCKELEAQNKILIESARANFHFSNANRLSAIQVQKSKYKK